MRSGLLVASVTVSMLSCGKHDELIRTPDDARHAFPTALQVSKRNPELELLPEPLSTESARFRREGEREILEQNMETAMRRSAKA